MAEDDINVHYILKRGMKVLYESTTLTEQFLCGLCFFFVLKPVWLLVWYFYFMVGNFCTIFRDDLDIPSAGWKEMCTLDKLGIVMEAFIEKDFGYSLDGFEEWVYNFIHDLLLVDEAAAVTENEGLEMEVVQAEDNVVPVVDELCEEGYVTEDSLPMQLEQSGMNVENLKTNVAQLRLDRESKTAQVIHLENLLDESRDLKTELMAKNGRLFEKLSASEAKCNKLEDLLISTLVSNKDLEEQADQLKASLNWKSERAEEASKTLQDAISYIIESLEMEKSELFAKLSIANGKLEQFAALSLEYEKEYALSQAESYKTLENYRTLSSEYELHKAESYETIGQLVTEKNNLLENLDNAVAYAKYLRELSLECETAHKLEEAKLMETIEAQDIENDQLLEKLSTADANVEHFKALSSEYKEANAKLVEEKNKLISCFQNDKESAEFRKRPFHEYHFF